MAALCGLASITATAQRRSDDVRRKLEWLQTVLRRLRATLWDADKRQINDEALLLWLQEIKDVVCEAEDVVDELDYNEVCRQVKGHRGQGEGGLRRQSPLPSLNKALVHRIDEIRRRLEDVEKDKNGLLIGDLGNREDGEVNQRRMLQQTSSLIKEEEVLGREDEKEDIVNFLTSPDDETIPSIVAITGMGGLGKTTLAQLVYNDGRVQDHFNLKIWVCTNAHYDVVKLTSEILGSTGYDMRFLWGVENLDVYQRKLMEILKGKRFLLVIDNFWDPNRGKWQCLSAPLFHGQKGSKVLITTRDTRVAKILQTRKIVKLEGLSFQDCWMLFERHAFVGGKSAEYPRLEAIGKRIVQKFGGVPLAAIAVGDLLHSNIDERAWTRIIESGIQELENGEEGILFILKLSYEHLPPQMKKCFAYCSLYPKGFKFERLELVQQWMGQGFLHSESNGRMEDVGAQYFKDMLNKSFFQFVDGKFVMHDLIHDLALFILHNDHLIANLDGSYSILRSNHNLRHLSLLLTNKHPDKRDLKGLFASRGLRTLVFHFFNGSRFEIPHGLFQALTSLRVLDLSGGGLESLPDSIGKLRHLRYLDLSRNNLRSLPQSFSCLYLLLTLKLKGCQQLKNLPQGICNLINLRHLEIETHLLSGLNGIRKLTGLQKLETFSIPQGHGIRISDLKCMNELRGTLSITNLHRVRNREDAVGAMLHNKMHIHSLKMEWRWGIFAECTDTNVEEVLEALVPPPNLKELEIKGYDGERCPSWIANQAINKLESLHLSICNNLHSIPLLWSMPFLRSLEITDCPQLRNLPPLPSTLQVLVLRHLEIKELPDFYEPWEPAIDEVLNYTPSLSTLRIENCDALVSLQQGFLRNHLRNLTVLCIENCRQLVQWPENPGFQETLLSLREELSLKQCPKLTAFPQGNTLSSSLKNLTIIGCPGVVNAPLFTQLHMLTSESVVQVRKGYTNFAFCYREALQNLKKVDSLEIDEIGIEEDGDFLDSDQIIHLVCHTAQIWSWRTDNWVVAWRVQLRCRRPPRAYHSLAMSESIYVKSGCLSSQAPLVQPGQEWWERLSPSSSTKRTAATSDHHDESLISKFLKNHCVPWVPSLRWLVLAASHIIHQVVPPSFNPTSLEGLWISRCGGTQPFLTDGLLHHLTDLIELQLFDCPDMKLPNLQETLYSLPSLRHLTIEKCPGLSLFLTFPSTQDNPHIVSKRHTLQTLFLDDINVLGAAQFVDAQLHSLRGLHIWYARHATFSTAAAAGLRNLGRVIQHLSIMGCPNLRHLPADMSLLPSLRALAIGHCPMLQHLRVETLPMMLEILVINNCPLLFGGQEKLQQQQIDKEWSKAHQVPVIVINEEIVKGTHGEYLELKAKWRNF